MTRNQYAYAKEHLDNIPDDIIERFVLTAQIGRRYKLRMIADKRGYVLIEIRIGMYGLP